MHLTGAVNQSQNDTESQADRPLDEKMLEEITGGAVAIPAFMKNARKAKTTEAQPTDGD